MWSNWYSAHCCLAASYFSTHERLVTRKKGEKAAPTRFPCVFCSGHVARVWLCHSDRTVMSAQMIECLVCHSLIKQFSLRGDGWWGRACPGVMAPLHVYIPIHNLAHSPSIASVPLADQQIASDHLSNSWKFPFDSFPQVDVCIFKLPKFLLNRPGG